jgi:hypothetical protein
MVRKINIRVSRMVGLNRAGTERYLYQAGSRYEEATELDPSVLYFTRAAGRLVSIG